MNDWQVYLLRCSDQTLYCGITNNIDARLKTHNAGKGARYTRGRLPVEIIETSEKMTRSDALKLERVIKKLPKTRKISALIDSRINPNQF
ncbi:GIY-YIG nuclease family protein [Desulfamplus magnetovallimortis]|nr:GIY-YIG nuclease family protein [Desulfamplus magnetovallimortis]